MESTNETFDELEDLVWDTEDFLENNANLSWSDNGLSEVYLKQLREDRVKALKLLCRSPVCNKQELDVAYHKLFSNLYINSNCTVPRQ